MQRMALPGEGRPGQANISSCLWGLLDLRWEPHKEKVERIKGERQREPVGRLGTPDEELRGTQEEPCPETEWGLSGPWEASGSNGLC